MTATLIGITVLAAATVVTAALTAPPRPAELPTVDTVPRRDPDEGWARETTAELRAIRADLAATATEEHRRMRRQRRLDGLAALKWKLVLQHRLRQAGWRKRRRLP